MAKKKNSKVRDYRQDEKWKNNPPIDIVLYEGFQGPTLRTDMLFSKDHIRAY